MTRTYSVYLIGLGQIGMGYGSNVDPPMLINHCESIMSNPRLEFVAAFDTDFNKCDQFRFRYNLPILNIHEVNKKIDIVVIASPTDYHMQHIIDCASSLQPSVILCEKPLSNSYKESVEIVEFCEARNISLFVNYMRRSLPGTNSIKSMISEQIILKPFFVDAWYTKSIIHNGTHLLDLFLYIYGDKNFKILPVDANETSASFRLDSSRVRLTKVDTIEFTLFEFTLFAKNGCLRYFDSGEKIEWFNTSSSEIFDGYQFLQSTPIEIYSGHKKYQYYVYSELLKFLDTEPIYSLCTGRESLSSLQLAHQLTSKIS